MKSLVLNACNYVLAFLPKLILFAINTCERHYTTFVSSLYILFIVPSRNFKDFLLDSMDLLYTSSCYFVLSFLGSGGIGRFLTSSYITFVDRPANSAIRSDGHFVLTYIAESSKAALYRLSPH